MALPLQDKQTLTIRGTISTINCLLPWYGQLTIELDNNTSVEYWTDHYRTIRMFYNWYGGPERKVTINKVITIDILTNTGEIVGFR